jgi:suppressor of ftsI/bilirubin oxidase
LDKSRRRRLILAAGTAAASAGLAGGLWWWGHTRRGEPLPPPEPPLPPDPAFPNALRLPGADGMYGMLEAQAATSIVARPMRYPLLDGKQAHLLGYEVEHRGRIFYNPTFRARTGSSVNLTFWNALEDPGIIHWHGFKVDSNNDGHPHYAVPGGATYEYQFTIPNRAGTYWYHPHPHGLSGQQIYRGMAGLFIVEDTEEFALQRELDLQPGATDIPLIVQDRRLDTDGNPVFAPTGDERFHGYLGDEVLVNLTRRPHLDVASRMYRFRVLNGSNARIYRLAFRHGERLLDFTVIGADGGLLEQPHVVREALLSPAERLDVLLDLRYAARADVVSLVSLPFNPMHQVTGQSPGAHAAHGHHASQRDQGPAAAAPGSPIADGAEIELMRIRVRSRTTYGESVPSQLSRFESSEPGKLPPRIITLDQKNGVWRINGLTYVGHETPIVVKRGAVETWEIRNVPPSMPHPFHIHGFLFQVRSRSNSPEHVRRVADAKTGLTVSDLGWKDTVLVWPGETVRLVIDFSHPYLGDQVYMVHCHNMEHEDGGMMLNFKVSA